MRKLFIVLFLALAGTIANAETEPISSVNPLVVMGFEFGKPHGLPACKNNGIKEEEVCVVLPSASMIISPTANTNYSVHYPVLPTIFEYDGLSISCIEGKVVRVEMPLNLQAYETTKAYITGKLGNPVEVYERDDSGRVSWVLNTSNGEIYVDLMEWKDTRVLLEIGAREYYEAEAKLNEWPTSSPPPQR